MKSIRMLLWLVMYIGVIAIVDHFLGNFICNGHTGVYGMFGEPGDIIIKCLSYMIIALIGLIIIILATTLSMFLIGMLCVFIYGYGSVFIEFFLYVMKIAFKVAWYNGIKYSLLIGYVLFLEIVITIYGKFLYNEFRLSRIHMNIRNHTSKFTNIENQLRLLYIKMIKNQRVMRRSNLNLEWMDK